MKETHLPAFKYPAVAVAVVIVCCCAYSRVWAQEEGLFDLRMSGSEPLASTESGIFDYSIDEPSRGMFRADAVDTVAQGMPVALGSETDDSQLFGDEDDLMSVNFENVDIRDVIQIFADKGQVNMIVGPGVTATVNLQLKNVSWRKALQVVLMTYNLTYKEDEGLIRIMTLDQMQKEDEKIPLETKIVRLNFARAETIKSNFESMLSSRGRIEVNMRTNSLIITDLPDTITRIERIAVQLDTRTPQVMIEVLIADVKVVSDDQLGIQWSLAWREDKGDGRGASQTLGAIPGAFGKAGGAVRFGTTILDNKGLQGIIGFLQSQNRVNVLAHPQILTLDNLPATIQLTEEIPYTQQTQTTDGALATTSFKTAGIQLTVTPHITTRDNFVFLDLAVQQSFRSGFTDDGQPIIDRRAAATNFLVKDRETAVIGGLRKKDDTLSVSKLPILGDIPMVGALFRNRTSAVNETDLMIFVTPTIIDNFILTAKEEDRLGLFEEETEDWVGKFDQIKRKKTPERIQQQVSAPGHPREYFYLRPPQLIGENW